MLAPNWGMPVNTAGLATTGFTLNGELITNNLSNLKVHLNVDFSKNHYCQPYEMNSRFPSSYYNSESQPFLTPNVCCCC